VGHLEEAISTCRFALRCAQLSSDVLANEEINAEELVRLTSYIRYPSRAMA
jgi:hypothetical protein